jgi:predicted nucleic acid-binding protein
MKTNKAVSASTHPFQRDEPILIDANIWLYLNPSSGSPSPHWVQKYSSVLSNMLKCRALILVDSIILSEYVNRSFRLEFSAAGQHYGDFKSFRKSASGITFSKTISNACKQILKIASPVDTMFSKANHGEVFGEIEGGGADFNDLILSETCRENGWKLLTNDADFKKGGITILTENPALLKSCP